MSDGLERPPPRVGLRVVGIAAAVFVMAVAVLAVANFGGRGGVAGTGGGAPAGRPDEPIPAEALVFRTAPGDLAVEPASARRTLAHRRTLATWRGQRAYPGAPPRIPHGLSPEEYRGGSCLTCHRRGGYVPRFEAYAPPTPHPEYTQCLQCHVPDAPRVGIPLPTDAGPSCGQCHVDPDAAPPTFALSDWRPAAWPTTGTSALPGSPPPIPHALEMRGNCLSCHGGPSAVEEIRTTHPERASCRQCHALAAADDAVFVRPVDAGAAGAAGAGGER